MTDIVTVVVTPAVSALIGVLVASAYGRVKRSASGSIARDKAIADGMRVMLRKQIVDAYDLYVHQRGKMTVERRSEVDEAYRVYDALGGNGTVTHLYEEIKDVDVWIERGGHV